MTVYYYNFTVKLVKSADVTLATSTSTISTTISTNCLLISDFCLTYKIKHIFSIIILGENWSWEKNGVTIAGITGISDSTSDKLNEPWNIFVDSKSNILYIADSQNHRVQQWLPWATSGITIAGTGVSGSTSTLLNTPKDVFLDSFENIYVADAGNQRIQFFPKDSKVASTVSLNWSCASIGAVQVVNESIYACDYNRSSILNNGSEVASNQWTNNTGDLLSLPQGFAVDTTMVIGTIYVANSNKHTIVKWPVKASTGITVAGVYGIAGNTSNLLAYPTSIKLDQYANIFVVDNNNHRIQLFCQYPIANSTGRTIVGTGKSGQTADTLNYPIGIALDASLNLYVSDTGNHRIQKFRRLL